MLYQFFAVAASDESNNFFGDISLDSLPFVIGFIVIAFFLISGVRKSNHRAQKEFSQNDTYYALAEQKSEMVAEHLQGGHDRQGYGFWLPLMFSHRDDQHIEIALQFNVVLLSDLSADEISDTLEQESIKLLQNEFKTIGYLDITLSVLGRLKDQLRTHFYQNNQDQFRIHEIDLRFFNGSEYRQRGVEEIEINEISSGLAAKFKAEVTLKDTHLTYVKAFLTIHLQGLYRKVLAYDPVIDGDFYSEYYINLVAILREQVKGQNYFTLDQFSMKLNGDLERLYKREDQNLSPEELKKMIHKTKNCVIQKAATDKVMDQALESQQAHVEELMQRSNRRMGRYR